MNWLLKVTISFVSVILLTVGAAAQDRIAVENFAHLPSMTNVRVSPDGTHLAWVGRHTNGLPAVYTYEIATGQILHRWESVDEASEANARVDLGASDVRDEQMIEGFEWLSGDRLAVIMTFPRVRSAFGERITLHEYRVLAVNADGSNGLILFDRGRERDAPQWRNPLVDVVDDDHVLALYPGDALDRNEFNDPPYELRRVNHRTGDNSIVEPHQDLSFGWDTCGWRTDANGVVVLRAECHEEDGEDDFLRRYSWRSPAGGEWHVMAEVTARENDYTERTFSVLSVPPSGGYAYVSSRHNDREGLYRVSFTDPNTYNEVFLHDQYDMQTAAFHPETGEPVWVMYYDEFPTYVYLDEELGAWAADVNAAMPGEVAALTSMSDGGRHLVFATYGDQEVVTYSLVDTQTGSFSIISPAYPGLPADQMGVRERVVYSARDGMTIEGIVNYPPGMTAADGPFPTVVMPHGGPFGPQDDASFDSLAQFIASRGYLVFQPNFRGSGGYGYDFEWSARRAWGAEMQTDITDGALHLINDLGIADASRMCIVGWSYGAYAALQEVTVRSDMYQCAVGINGVYDLVALIVHVNDRQFASRGTKEFWENNLGRAADNAARLRETSPTLHAENIGVPVMIAVGREDLTAPPAQSDLMWEALQAAPAARRGELEHVLVDIELGEHSMIPDAARVETFEALEAFLDEHL